MSHPDPTRMHATVYERLAWKHDIGEHEGSSLPFAYCPRCEMEHPLGRFAEMERAKLAIEAQRDALEGALAQACDDAWADGLGAENQYRRKFGLPEREGREGS